MIILRIAILRSLFGPAGRFEGFLAELPWLFVAPAQLPA
jgi:hypothetical protein